MPRTLRCFATFLSFDSTFPQGPGKLGYRGDVFWRLGSLEVRGPRESCCAVNRGGGGAGIHNMAHSTGLRAPMQLKPLQTPPTATLRGRSQLHEGGGDWWSFLKGKVG